MQRLGAVVVFAPGVTREQAEAKLNALTQEKTVDGDYYVLGRPTVEEFDDEWGGPVWYIP